MRARLKSRTSIIPALCLLLVMSPVAANGIFGEQPFTNSDSVLVTSADGEVLYQWRADQSRVPASLTKLVTAWLALDKWGADHRFHTDFFIENDILWVKGFGDPYLVSEELDQVAMRLQDKLRGRVVNVIAVDGSYFAADKVPGRSQVNDPYNAPLSAVAANFNTIMLQQNGGNVTSGEAQTPLTSTAKRLAKNMRSQRERINLRTSANAHRYFAELLAAKLGLGQVELREGKAPESCELLYRHFNSRTLAENLRGALAFSNNFISNQLFLKLGEKPSTMQVGFASAQAQAADRLQQYFGWSGAKVVEGSGLSRRNQLSAKQIDQLLQAMLDYRDLLDPIKLDANDVQAWAKTGTLDGVRSYAGFLNIGDASYRFVFVFNRPVPYGFRDTMLRRLIRDLQTRMD